MDEDQHVTLCINFFFVQGQPFFHTLSRNLKFHTVSAVKNQKHLAIQAELGDALKLYQPCSFMVARHTC